MKRGYDRRQECQKHVKFRISGFVLSHSLVRFKTFIGVCIFSDTVCDKGITLRFFESFLIKENAANNIEINTNKLFSAKM